MAVASSRPKTCSFWTLLSLDRPCNGFGDVECFVPHQRYRCKPIWYAHSASSMDPLLVATSTEASVRITLNGSHIPYMQHAQLRWRSCNLNPPAKNHLRRIGTQMASQKGCCSIRLIKIAQKHRIDFTFNIETGRHRAIAREDQNSQMFNHRMCNHICKFST